VEVLLGALGSIFYGVADFLGGEAARRAPASTVVFWAGALSFPLIVGVGLVVGGNATVGDYLLGIGAGTSGAFGLVFLFAGLSRADAAAVAPAAAALAAVVPVLVALVDGERPSPLAWAGVTIAIPAIVLCSWEARPGRRVGASVGYGLVAGLGFGGFTAIIRYTSQDSNLLPLISSRAATMAVVVALAGVGVWKLGRLSSTPRWMVVGNALFDVSGNVALLLAVRAGSLALAAVASSFYPAITVAMARIVSSQHLRRRQLVGLALTLVAMTIIVLG
jgi:drug/metabolite transporter (DMT)-like permease